MKKYIPYIPLPQKFIGKKQLVYRSQIMLLKTKDFCEYVKFLTISWKFDILLITA